MAAFFPPADAPPTAPETAASGVDRAKVAVALRYDAGSEAAPTVVASGRGAVAERILAAAAAAGVPLHQDPDLAALLAALDLDCEIPVEAFAAVAEILICLYRANAAAQPAETGR